MEMRKAIPPHHGTVLREIQGKAVAHSPTHAIAPEAANLIEEVTHHTVASHQRKMARYLLEITRLNGLDHLGKQPLPFLLLKYFQKVMELYDESTHFLLGELHRHGFTVQCKPECAHCCCNMPTGISMVELIYLYYGMQQSGLSARFFRRCLETEEVWANLLERHASNRSSPEPDANHRESLLKCYLHLASPCPFLLGKTCQVYRYRPFACRMHYSLSPPHWCQPSHFQNEHAVKFNLEPGECVQDALERLDSCFHLRLSDVMICGLLELTVNVMRFDEIRWMK